MLSQLTFKTGKYHYRFVLIAVFLLIGFVVSVISIFVSGYYQLHSLNQEINASAKNTLAHKKELMLTQTTYFKKYLAAIDKDSGFEGFIQNNQKDYAHITNIMMAITRSDPNIMQFRFIDENGHETIRIDRTSIDSEPYKVDKELLQNKADRYYFQETKKIGSNKVWFSHLDLNEEHGKIAEPITPTMRVAKPYYVNNEFKGILVINIFMQNILDEIMESELFNVAIIDKDSYILISNHKGHKNSQTAWTKYLENSKNIKFSVNQNENSYLLNLMFQKKDFNFEISDIIQNGEELKVVLEAKTEKLTEYTNDIIYYMLIMSLIIFIISFPLAILLSRYPIKMHEKLEKSKDDLKKQLEIIDEYVCISKTNLNGKIIDVSTAFTKISGYSKDELIGKNHNILKSHDVDSSLYENLWSTILNRENWVGELKNVNKDGHVYWIKNHIFPKIEKGEVVGFTAIGENITDKKNIEEISITDELTQTYNRRFFNQTFPIEFKRTKRDRNMLCIAMLDIDYFKKYNDTYGHIKGDEVLQKVVAQISEKLQRPTDYLFRVGGEEFIVLYSDIQDFDEAKKFAFEIVASVEKLNIEHKESECAGSVTISLGLLGITANCDMNEDAILKRVDELLYMAKESGRNRFVSQEC